MMIRIDDNHNNDDDNDDVPSFIQWNITTHIYMYRCNKE